MSFAATGLPTGAAVTFSPSSTAANGGAQTVTLTVQASAQAKLDSTISHRGGLIAFALLFLPLAGTRRTRRVAQTLGHRTSLALLLLSLGAVAGLSNITLQVSKKGRNIDAQQVGPRLPPSDAANCLRTQMPNAIINVRNNLQAGAGTVFHSR